MLVLLLVLVLVFSVIDHDDDLCVICFSGEKNSVMVPCGHICVCINCAKQIMEQPAPECCICRTPVIQTVKIIKV